MRVAGGRLDERPAVVGVAEGEAVGVVVVGGIGGPGGRVGRQAYALAGLLLLVVQFFVFYRFISEPERSQSGSVWAMVFMVVGTAQS